MKYFLVFLFIFSSSAIADDNKPQSKFGWLCQNKDFQISCSNGSCDVTSPTDGFTPMEVTFQNGHMNVCAYTGCWKGTPTIVEDDQIVYAFSHNLKWIHSSDPKPESFQIALNKSTKVAVLNGGGFAHAMHCEKWVCGEDCQADR